MPVRHVKSGFKCGSVGKVYHYKKGGVGKRQAEVNARKQCIAIHLMKKRRAKLKK